MTDLRLAHLTEHLVTRIWRLKLDAHGDQPSKVNDLPGFHGSIHDEENRAKISGILGTIRERRVGHARAGREGLSYPQG